MADPDLNGNPVDRVVKALAETKSYHDLFVRKVEDRYRSYRGILQRNSEAEQWTSKLHPPYVLQAIEAMVANMVEEDLTFSVAPQTLIAEPLELQQAKEGADAVEVLLEHQARVDDLDGKQRTFVLQALITGMSVVKNYWKHVEGTGRTYMGDEYGTPIEYERDGVVYRDDPCTEVVDIRDFFRPEAATSLASCEHVIHRVWKTFDELKRLETAGYYKNVDDLKNSKSYSDEYQNREEALFAYSRTKDRIEVMEMWTADGQAITIGNRRVLLRQMRNPFWFDDLDHKYPFVTCSGRPDMFRMEGISEVELIGDIQEAMWSLMNQRIDGLKLMNNAIFMVRSDLLDRDSLNFFPGAIWEMDDPAGVNMFSPNPAVGQISLEAEALLKGDLQNVTGGMPFLSGTESSSIDQQTATGVSIITTLAQKMVSAKKREFQKAWARVGDQWIRLNQQYLREPRMVQVIGQEGAADLQTIMPAMIQGNFRCTVKAAGESLVRQERVAEKQAHLQVASQVAPILQAVGTPLNLQAVYEDYLEAMGIKDKTRYFASPAQPALPPGGPGGAAPGGPAPVGGEQPMGVTSPLAYGPSSPSSQTSLSPMMHLQRALAMRGGAANGGGGG